MSATRDSLLREIRNQDEDGSGSTGGATAANQEALNLLLKDFNGTNATIEPNETGTISSTDSTEISGANGFRQSLVLCNRSSSNYLLVTLSEPATVSNWHIRIKPESFLSMHQLEYGFFVNQSINAIAESGTVEYTFLDALQIDPDLES